MSPFPFPVRCVQTDHDSLFTPWYTAGPKTPLDRPVTAHPFTEMCAHFGATHRLMPPRTDDEEFYHLRQYATREDLRRAFPRWLWHYNHTRLHTGAGMHGRSPLQQLQIFPAYAEIKELKCYPC